MNSRIVINYDLTLKLVNDYHVVKEIEGLPMLFYLHLQCLQEIKTKQENTLRMLAIHV